MGESILVVRSEELKEHVDFQGFLPLDSERVHALYDALEVIPMDRDLAEEDPTYKQFVAYSAIKAEQGWLAYVRGKGLGEARLHGNRSMGIGGHIDAGDHASLFIGDHLMTAAHREIDEEISVAGDYSLRLAGLLNDDSNEVGKVHIGLVYVAQVSADSISKRERGIAQLRFMDEQELQQKYSEFETWSQILIDNLSALR